MSFADIDSTACHIRHCPTENQEVELDMFTPEEIRLFQKRKEEGYDIPNPRYERWLASSHRIRKDPAVSALDTTKKLVPASGVNTVQTVCSEDSDCQRSLCNHPKARQWIGCDRCQRWYHCLCAQIPHKKARDLQFTCSTCSSI